MKGQHNPAPEPQTNPDCCFGYSSKAEPYWTRLLCACYREGNSYIFFLWYRHVGQLYFLPMLTVLSRFHFVFRLKPTWPYCVTDSSPMSLVLSLCSPSATSALKTAIEGPRQGQDGFGRTQHGSVQVQPPPGLYIWSASHRLETRSYPQTSSVSVWPKTPNIFPMNSKIWFDLLMETKLSFVVP